MNAAEPYPPNTLIQDQGLVPALTLLLQETEKGKNKETRNIITFQTLSSIYILSHSQINKIIAEYDERTKTQ